MYMSNKSYTNNEFISIYNWNTKEYTDKMKEFAKEIKWQQVYNDIKTYTTLEDEKRGIPQMNISYTGRSYDKKYDILVEGVMKPTISCKKSTKHSLNNMITLSKLLIHMKGSSCFMDEDRNTLFANKVPLKFAKKDIISLTTAEELAKTQILEGFTSCLSNKDKLLQCHVDIDNDRKIGYDAVICFNKQIIADQKIQRIALLGYGKNVVLNFTSGGKIQKNTKHTCPRLLIAFIQKK